MNDARLTGKARAAAKVVEKARKKRIAKMRSAASFTPVPRTRKRTSTRGLTGEPWLTKRHTPSRIKDMKEAREEKKRARA